MLNGIITSIEDKQKNLSLEAFTSTQSLPQIFDVRNKYSVLRADKIGDEFNVQYIFKGSGDEYQMYRRYESYQREIYCSIKLS